MKNAFDGHISRLDWPKKRTSELEGMSIETSKIEKQRGNSLGKKAEQTIQEQWDN